MGSALTQRSGHDGENVAVGQLRLFFGLAHKVNDPTEAVMQLGLQTIKSLVLGIRSTELQSAKGSQIEMEKIFHQAVSPPPQWRSA